MKECTICGNEISDQVSICPFCENQQVPGQGARQASRARVLNLNVKEDMPTADEAVERMDRRLRSARLEGVKIVRVVHGYGASGKGGVIREETRRRLPVLIRENIIMGFVYGEDYEMSDIGRGYRDHYPELKKSLRTDRNNPGITFVEIR